MSIDFPKEAKISVTSYKAERKRELRVLGFNENVIEFLFEKFWYRDKGALFEFCSYHEKVIIEKLQVELRILSDCGSYLRRHDSVISFRTLNEAQISFINNFEYLDKKGWFKGLNEIEKSVFNDQLLKSGQLIHTV